MARIFISFDTDSTFNEDYKDRPKSFTFKNQDFVLSAAFEIGQQHKICLLADADDLTNYGSIREILSSLSWKERMSVREISSGAHGQESTPCLVDEAMCGPLSPGRAIGHMYIDGLFEYENETQAIALALYRQARNAWWANFPLYTYLSFFKIVELAAGGAGEKQLKNLIKQKVESGILHHKSQFVELTKSPGLGVRKDANLINSFYSHRQDCAHALRGSRTFNPDGYPFYRGLVLHIPLLEEMAENVMINDLNIPR
ncbi:MAG: methylamine utilization protein MauJ [Candidatus Uhrbacteria bacterium]